MAFDSHSNLAYSTLTNSPGTAGVSFVLQSGEAARFPTPPFNATVWPAAAIALNTGVANTTAEIVRVTAIVSDTLTVTRSTESIGSGSTAANAVAGYQIIAAATKKVFTDIETALNLLSAFRSVSANTTLASTDRYVLASAASGAITLTLPDATTLPSGWSVTVKKTDNTTNNVGVATTSSQTIDGSAAEPLRISNLSRSFVTDSLNWYLF